MMWRHIQLFLLSPILIVRLLRWLLLETRIWNCLSMLQSTLYSVMINLGLFAWDGIDFREWILSFDCMHKTVLLNDYILNYLLNVRLKWSLSCGFPRLAIMICQLYTKSIHMPSASWINHSEKKTYSHD